MVIIKRDLSIGYTMIAFKLIEKLLLRLYRVRGILKYQVGS